MQTTNIVDENIKRIGELFPNCLTERLNAEGKPEVAIDFDQLRQELSKDIVEGQEERYQFTWPDKRNAIRLANAPTTDTLRPCREESVDFDNTQNLYIEGDNLQVLKLLRENYLGKVKMIYIDPPYNTGKDFVYNDDFAQSSAEYIHNSGQTDEEGNRLVANTENNGRFHTDWLNMIYPRLKVAKDLLTDDGVIFISIDDNEVENLKKICNEVFGTGNLCGMWNWFKSATPPNLSKKIKKNIEYVLAYQKGSNTEKFRGVQKSSNSDDPFTKPQNTLKELTFPAGSIHTVLGDGEYEAGIYGTEKFPNELLNNIIIKDGLNVNDVIFKNKFIWVQDKLNEELANGTRVNLSKKLVLSYKKAEYNVEVPPNLIDNTTGVGTTEQAGDDLDKYFDGKRVFSYPKPVSLINYLLNFVDNKDCTILDFFSGSSTTAEAVMRINTNLSRNCKFIMVQLQEDLDKSLAKAQENEKQIIRNAIELCDQLNVPHSLCEIAKERIRRAGKKIKEESPLASQDLDTGFRVLKLDSSNMQDVYYTPADFNDRDLFEENIKPDRTDEDLLFQSMIELGIELSAKIVKTEIAGKTVWNVSDGYLLACFDEGVNETTITEIAKQQPYYFIMRDSSLANDNVADNFEQIFEHYSKDTIRRIL